MIPINTSEGDFVTVAENWMVSNMGDPHQRKAHSMHKVNGRLAGRCGYNPSKAAKLRPTTGETPHCPRCEERLRFARLQNDVSDGFDKAGEEAHRQVEVGLNGTPPDEVDHILAVDAENTRLKDELVKTRSNLYRLYEVADKAWKAFMAYGPVDLGGMTEQAGVNFDEALVELKATANLVRKADAKLREKNHPPVGGPAGGVSPLGGG